MVKNTLQQGRSMVETMGYIGVVIALVIAMGTLVKNAFDDHKTGRAYSQLTELAKVISSSAVTDTNYADVVSMINTKTNTDGRKMIPDSFKVSESGSTRIIKNAFGGNVEVFVPSGDDADKFSIKFMGMNRKQCTEMAVQDWTKNQSAELFSLKINNNNAFYWPAFKTGVANNQKLPVKRSVITGTGNNNGQCKKGTTNYIIWTFF